MGFAAPWVQALGLRFTLDACSGTLDLATQLLTCTRDAMRFGRIQGERGRMEALICQTLHEKCTREANCPAIFSLCKTSPRVHARKRKTQCSFSFERNLLNREKELKIQILEKLQATFKFLGWFMKSRRTLPVEAN